jgi:hypothetical protein
MPRKPDPRKPLEADLFACWNTFGIESDKCRHIELKLDTASDEFLKNSKKQDSTKVIKEIKATLNKPVYPFFKKGAHRDLVPRPYTMYDGLDGLI